MRGKAIQDEAGEVSRCQTVQGLQATAKGLDLKSEVFLKCFEQESDLIRYACWLEVEGVEVGESTEH